MGLDNYFPPIVQVFSTIEVSSIGFIAKLIQVSLQIISSNVGEKEQVFNRHYNTYLVLLFGYSLKLIQHKGKQRHTLIRVISYQTPAKL